MTTDEVGQEWLRNNPATIVGSNKTYTCSIEYIAPTLNSSLTEDDVVTIEDRKNLMRYLPNMGVYKCFLSNGRLSHEYFTHPIFLYFQLYLMIIQAANMFFLVSTLVTVRRLFRNQDKMKGGEKSLKSYKKQFSTIGRLCIVMGGYLE